MQNKERNYFNQYDYLCYLIKHLLNKFKRNY